MGTPSKVENMEKSNSDQKERNLKIVNGTSEEDKNIIIQSSVGCLVGSVPVDESEDWKGKGLNLGQKFRILKRTDQIWEFQTVIRGNILSRWVLLN